MQRRMIVSIVFVSILLIVSSKGLSQLKAELTNDPLQVALIDDDVHNFIHAMDLISTGSDTAAILQKEYLDKASPGLKEFQREKEKTVDDWIRAIRKYPKSYASLRGLSEALSRQEKKIRKAYADLKKVIPGTVFMPAYYMVGAGTGAMGEPSEYGLMIAICELDEDIEGFHKLLVHETIHVQQALTVGIEEYQSIYGPKRSLLAIAIREGAADFLTSLVTGSYSHKETYEYLVMNEKKLWKRFKAEMTGPETGDWMWRRPKNPDEPPNLGYSLGARIVEAYYHLMDDKVKAVEDILAITDYKGFLKKSRYGKSF